MRRIPGHSGSPGQKKQSTRSPARLEGDFRLTATGTAYLAVIQAKGRRMALLERSVTEQRYEP